MEDRQRPVGNAAVGDAAASAGVAFRLDAALLVLMWIGAVVAWSTLPESFPIHFDLRGRPDSWARRDGGGLVLWLLLPALATGTSILLRLVTRWAAPNPALWNVPRKKEFLALTDAQREPIVEIMTRMLAWVCVCTTILIGLMIYGIWLEARAAAAGSLVLFLVFAYLIGVGAITLRLNGQVRRMIDRQTGLIHP